MTMRAKAAQVTFSNLTELIDGYHGVADQGGSLLGGAGSGGNLGRMTIDDSTITTLATARDLAALNAAFVPFGGTFPLDGAPGVGNGAIEAVLTADTKASLLNGFGESAIYVWLYKGTSRTTATEFMLVKLNSVFPTDPEVGPPLDLEVYLRPVVSSISTLFAGVSGPQTHDYGLGSAATIFRMVSTVPPGSNQPPLSNPGTLEAFAGIAKAGQLTGSDPEDASLTFSKVTDPGKGTVVVQSNGSFVYTANEGQSGSDSFTFKVNDGELDSSPATITITISPAPPNQAPVGVPASFSVTQNDLLTGTLQATDFEGGALTFAVTSGPLNGTVSNVGDGTFSYLPNHQFIGDDSFTFTANDGTLTSVPVTVVVVVNAATPGWTWMNGEQAVNLNGVYGVQGVPSAANRPGARSLAASVSSGSAMYVFGGLGRGESGAQGLLNDLWHFDSASNQWTWISGGKVTNVAGDYGTQGVGAAARVPGGRSGAVLWVDDVGLVWLFGGTGRASNAAQSGELNDLWRFDPGTGHWTWIKGEAAVNSNGVYGTLGLSDSSNGPGARSGATGWRDGSGRLWVFGGKGRGAVGSTSGFLNDLWRFDSVSNEWTHCHGSTQVNPFGQYGAEGLEVPNQGPGGRSGASAWLDANGQFWIFGGQGLADKGKAGYLNDLWIFNPASQSWKGGIFRPESGTWLSSPGPVKTNVPGVNGVLGQASPANYPASRAGAVASLGGNGKLILFGGSGAGSFNDVWSFDPATSQWAWLKGHAKANQAGVYGQKGIASASNTPGARGGSVGFVSPSGHLWVSGGAAGAKAYSDGWSLRLPATPSVDLAAVVVTGENTAELEATVVPNVTQGETALSVVFSPLANAAAAITQMLPALPAGSGATEVTHDLTGLAPGTEYQVTMIAENAAGTASSVQRVFRTQGTAAPVTIGFASLASEGVENSGAVMVEVRLTAPVADTVTVPVTVEVGGTATASDFTSPASSVVLVPGQTTAFVVVNLVNDLVVESDEMLTLVLGQPVPGSVTLGANASHEVTLLDDDATPVATLASVIAELGAEAQLQVQMSTQETFKYQWKKAGKKIAGATTSSLLVPAVQLADAGLYTVDITLPRGGVVSPSAQLAVVDTSARRALGRENVAVTVSVPTAGTGLTFEWRKVGNGTVLDTTSALTLGNPQVADAGDYERTTLLPGVGQLVTVVTLNLVTEAPVLNLPNLTQGYVGSHYLHILEASNEPAGEADSFTVTGLPKGLVASAQGVISGVPKAPVVNKLITIIASNPFQSAQSTALLTINPPPSALAGTYGAWIAPESGFNGGGLGGRVDVTITPSGSFTAKVQTGTDVRSVKGPVSVAVNGSSLGIQAQLVKKGLPTLVIDLLIESMPLVGDLELSGTVADLGSGLSVPVEGVKLATQTSRVGTYNYGLLLDDALEGALAVPQGDGFGTAKVLATGKATFAGRAGDGTPYTAAVVMGKAGHVPLYLSAISLTTPGGLAGLAQVSTGVAPPLDNALDGDLTWGRMPALAKAKTKGYRAGFEGVPVTLLGGVYQGPVPGGIIAGLPAVEDNMELLFENRALIEGTLASLKFTIANAGGVKQKVIVPAINPAKVTFKLDKVPGSFAGGFTLDGATPALVRKAAYQGLFVRLPTGDFILVGYFLLAQPAEPGVKSSAAPELSGRVVLD
jgi:VCBS repeat-containing protein